MTAPKTDRDGITQAVQAAIAAGWKLEFAHDGEDEIKTSDVVEAVDAIMAVDQGSIHFLSADGQSYGYLFLVLGNDPDEVICDYTTNLESVIGPLTDAWFEDDECEGHESLAGEHMGETVYCDGACK